MDSMKNIRKLWLSSLSFLDNHLLNSIIVFILLLYCSTIFDNVNLFVGNLYNFSIVKLGVLLLIIYLSPKDTTISILLAISYLVSIYYMANNETFVDNDKHNKHKSILNEKFIAPVHMSEKIKDEMYNEMNNEMIHSSVVAPEPFSTSEEMPNMKHNMNQNVKQNMNHQIKELRQDKKYLRGMTENTNEHFFPLINEDVSTFDPRIDTRIDTQLSNVNVETKRKETKNTNQVVSSCMDMYVPHYESVGNVCEPTATFKNELNAQGLNYPEGFDSITSGSPL